MVLKPTHVTRNSFWVLQQQRMVNRSMDTYCLKQLNGKTAIIDTYFRRQNVSFLGLNILSPNSTVILMPIDGYLLSDSS